MGSKIALKNLQDQEFSINHLDGAGAISINSNDIAQNSKLFGFKNYIINGNFDVWQRAPSQTSNWYGSDDRWNNAHLGSTKTHSAVACTDTERALFNAVVFSRTVVTSVAGSGNFCLKQQAIEDVTRLAGKTVTLSFWAKADSNKNIEVRLLQTFGTGGTPSTQVNNIGQQLIALTNTWQKKTITIAIPSIVGKTLGTDGAQTTATWLRFTFDAGASFESSMLGQQSGTFDIAQVQLEEGSIATPFEQRPYGLELSLCKRYYGTISFYDREDDSMTNGTRVKYTPYPVIPRVTPSLAVLSVGYTNASGINVYTHNSEGIRIGWGYENPGPLGRDITAIISYSADL